MPPRNPAGMTLASVLHPAPPAQLPSESLTFSLCVVAIVAVAVIGGIALTLRR
jgi:hypothetical protein